MSKLLAKIVSNPLIWFYSDAVIKSLPDGVKEVVAAIRDLESGADKILPMIDELRNDRLLADVLTARPGFDAFICSKLIKSVTGNEVEITDSTKYFFCGVWSFSNAIAGKIISDLRKTKTQFKKNDINDCLHATYLPYVDIFCCDKDTKQCLSANPHAHKIVCSTSELVAMLSSTI